MYAIRSYYVLGVLDGLGADELVVSEGDILDGIAMDLDPAGPGQWE